MATPQSDISDQNSTDSLSQFDSDSASDSVSASAITDSENSNPREMSGENMAQETSSSNGELKELEDGKLAVPPYQVRVGGGDAGEGCSNTGSAITSVPESAESSGGNTAGGGDTLDTVVDHFFQRQRNELMFELRRLQHGERPVTGQGHREAVQNFFDRQLNQTDTDPVPAEQRPESVVVEVNALVERRPVSSVLQSRQFRQSLETALRGALGSVQSRPLPRRFPAATNQQRASPAPSLRDPRAEHLRTLSESRSSLNSQVSNSAEDQYDTASSEGPERRVPRPQTQPAPTLNAESSQPRTESPLEPSQLPQQQGPSRAQAWLQRQPLPADPRDETQRTVWETVEQAQRENVISDISELVQRQLVSSALDGHFRGLLEAHIRDRVVAGGTNGTQVQQFIQSLPPTQFHQRNDFSDLGIVDSQQQAAAAWSDDVSVISAAAAVTVPYAQSNTALNHELKSLKAQMKELQSMLRLSLDMQLDTQRAIRQEVAAALNQQGIATSSSLPPQQPRPVSDTQCLICLDKGADAVLYQCGHMCVCYTCGLALRSRGAHCPMCRAPIRDIIRVYKSSLE